MMLFLSLILQMDKSVTVISGSTELTGYSNSELKGLHNSKLFPDEFKRDIRYFLKYNLDRNIPSMKPLSKQNLM
jgi:hypothetical protein